MLPIVTGEAPVLAWAVAVAVYLAAGEFQTTNEPDAVVTVVIVERSWSVR